MDVADFDFELPREAIAQRPLPRGTARLMTLDRSGGAVGHRTIADFPDLLREGDVVVANDTRVIPARLFGTDREGRRAELLLVRPLPPSEAGGHSGAWECLGKPGRRLRVGRTFSFGEGVEGSVVGRDPRGRTTVTFSGSPLAERLDSVGTAPLPPYIHRPGGVADEADRTDYQTVFAREPGAIAAPTAGLHLTPSLIGAMERRGARFVTLTLHVGLGTFKPVKVGRVEEHVMDEERGNIPAGTAAEVNHALDEGRRIVAVGTTTVRTLEASARANSGRIAPGPFATALFLTPGARFEVVGALLTNFHLPRSTLLMLVASFAGRESVLAAYREALARGYRFFSYGDAMFIG